MGWLWQNSGLCQTAGQHGTACVYLSVCVCVCLSSLTESLHGDDFILAQALAGLVVCEPSRIEEAALNTLPETQQWNFKLRFYIWIATVLSSSSTQTPRICVFLITALNFCLVNYTLTVSHYAKLQRTQKLNKINTCCSCRKIGFNANVPKCDKLAGHASLLACFTLNTSEFCFLFRCVMYFLMYWPNECEQLKLTPVIRQPWTISNLMSGQKSEVLP